jgi:thioredoxin 1
MLFFIHPSCSKKKAESANEDNNSEQQLSNNQKSDKKIADIKNMEHFQKVIEQEADRLIVFEIYADWCLPCRILAPILEEIAEEKSDLVSFYKVDVDKHKTITNMLQVRSIPLVVFMKNKAVVKSFLGLQPKTAYLDAISEYAN